MNLAPAACCFCALTATLLLRAFRLALLCSALLCCAVPHAMRAFFPLAAKSYTSHDVILTCARCHRAVDAATSQLLKRLLSEFALPRTVKEAAEQGLATEATSPLLKGGRMRGGAGPNKAAGSALSPAATPAETSSGVAAVAGSAHEADETADAAAESQAPLRVAAADAGGDATATDSITSRAVRLHERLLGRALRLRQDARIVLRSAAPAAPPASGRVSSILDAHSRDTAAAAAAGRGGADVAPDSDAAYPRSVVRAAERLQVATVLVRLLLLRIADAHTPALAAAATALVNAATPAAGSGSGSSASTPSPLKDEELVELQRERLHVRSRRLVEAAAHQAAEAAEAKAATAADGAASAAGAASLMDALASLLDAAALHRSDGFGSVADGGEDVGAAGEAAAGADGEDDSDAEGARAAASQPRDGAAASSASSAAPASSRFVARKSAPPRYEPYYHIARSAMLGDARWRAAEKHFPPVSPHYVVRDPSFETDAAAPAVAATADLPHPTSVGASGLPAAAEQRLARVVQRWRANFLAACQPRALPAGWSVDYKVLQSGLRREGMTETPLVIEAISLLAGRACVT